MSDNETNNANEDSLEGSDAHAPAPEPPPEDQQPVGRLGAPLTTATPEPESDLELVALRPENALTDEIDPEDLAKEDELRAKHALKEADPFSLRQDVVVRPDTFRDENSGHGGSYRIDDDGKRVRVGN